MPRDLPLPTEGELRILRVLWKRGPSTVRQVLDALPGEETGYTTVLKLLQIMHTKGLVIRDERERTHVYAATVPPETTQRQLVADFTEKAFGGSALGLVMHALSPEVASREELEEIRRMVARLPRPEDE
ncbi:MAG: Transcriptional repressor, BlaI/MecI family [uncultured Gemmatimonadetes bacterium]|uniref:Transcriptional repressor, BlaI/MecI family n=1 Tax=uncultured Gemmatimonadota bacterium TaxID=203437 RepID=A0A6J4MU34_9BACT|nr:MAG: Transcriptional repressor, BlaI/MecI family [uncultured Gemmatimonadota bacterium]